MTRGTRLAGKVAILTGATSGIGEATAQLFVDEGARLVLVARRREVGQTLANRLGEGRAICVAGDVTDPLTAEWAVAADDRGGEGLGADSPACRYIWQRTAPPAGRPLPGGAR